MGLKNLRAIYSHLPLVVREAVHRHLPQRARTVRAILLHSAYWTRAGVVFIHVPKAAGTSVNLALYGRFMGHFTAAEVRRWGSAEVNALPSFAVTRNPWDRLVSAYRFLKLGKGVGGKREVSVRQAQQYRIPEFQSFETFVREWLAPRDLRKLDHALRPQWPFVCDRAGRVLVDHVGRVEDLRPTLDFLRDTIGASPDIPRSNTSGSAVNYRDFYTPSLVQLVAGLYAADIEKFSYDF
jgi:hypothetical protein